jgi:hypothetical protein
MDLLTLTAYLKMSRSLLRLLLLLFFHESCNAMIMKSRGTGKKRIAGAAAAAVA